MSNQFDRKEYNKKYYQLHKEKLNKKKVNSYGDKILLKTISDIDIDEQFRQVREAIIAYDDTDKSPENIFWLNQIILYTKVLGILKNAMISDEDRKNYDLAPILSIPLEGPRLPNAPTNL
jgi:hypothetical protein